MGARLAVLIILTLTISGCAITKNSGITKTGPHQMETRICELEGELSDKNQEISRLSRELEKVREDEIIFQKNNISKSEKSGNNKKELTNKSAKNIQLALKNAKYYNGSIDGMTGPKTKEAVKQFQRENRLTADGVVGKNTWLKLKQYLCPERG
ncbi:MAG: peptidoglycan-binding domain-containing protein [Candidatus Omnitrophota bacterium]